ncbi:MAG: tetratricopeptide repeat protein [Candidatus Eremiobacterota bacterium]
MKTEKIFATVFTELSETHKENCPDTETICAYIDNSLTFNERKGFENHLIDCSCCFNSYIDLNEEMDKVKELAALSPSFMGNKSEEKGFFYRLNVLFSIIKRSYWLSWCSSFALGSAITVMVFLFCINREDSIFFGYPQTGSSGYSSVNYVLTDVSGEAIALKHCKNGESFLQRSMIAKAKEEFLQSIKFNPDQSEAHWYLGVIYRDEGNYKEAIHHWKRYMSISPKVGSYEEAKKNLEKVQESYK